MAHRGAAAGTVLLLVLTVGCGRAQEPPQGEAEGGRLRGVEVSTETPGYSGTGYVTGFDRDDDEVLVDLEVARDGVYDLCIRYAAPHGPKGYELRLDTRPMGGMFTQTEAGAWAEARAGKAWLRTGRHAVRIGKGWGWFLIDRVELRPASVAPPPVPEGGLCDPEATPEARALFAWLKSLYGKRTIAGQQLGGEAELGRIRAVTGEEPALRGYDLMDYSPSRREHGADPGATTEQAIAWGRQGGIVAVSWHWNAPTDLIDQPGKEWYRGFYADSTTFELEAALSDPSSDAHALLVRDIDAIAVELRKLADADVPVLWRPLHEAAGRWFWWGAKGPEPLKGLWRLLYDRITVHHGLHNLVWVLSNGPGATEWYPGDDVVDIVGYDQYAKGGPEAAVCSGEWDALLAETGGRKMIAMTENGSIPDAGLMAQLEARWLWFCTWPGAFIEDEWNPAESLRATYTHPDIVTLARLR